MMWYCNTMIIGKVFGYILLAQFCDTEFAPKIWLGQILYCITLVVALFTGEFSWLHVSGYLVWPTSFLTHNSLESSCWYKFLLRYFSRRLVIFFSIFARNWFAFQKVFILESRGYIFALAWMQYSLVMNERLPSESWSRRWV